MNRVGRVATWLCIALLVVLSLVPGTERPHTGLAGQWEHFMAYAGTGTIAMLSYRHAVYTITGLALLSFILEALQSLIPGRGPAFTDAVLSMIGASAGTGLAVLLILAVSNATTVKRRWHDR